MVALTTVIMTHTAPDALFPPLPSTIIATISYPNSTIPTITMIPVEKPQADNYQHITLVIFSTTTSQSVNTTIRKKSAIMGPLMTMHYGSNYADGRVNHSNLAYSLHLQTSHAHGPRFKHGICSFSHGLPWASHRGIFLSRACDSDFVPSKACRCTILCWSLDTSIPLVDDWRWHGAKCLPTPTPLLLNGPAIRGQARGR